MARFLFIAATLGLIAPLVVQVPAAVADQASATDITVAVVVRDGATGQPLPATSIVVDGRATPVICDEAGRVTISGPRGAMLVLEHDGFDSAVVSIDGVTLDVALVRLAATAETIEVKANAPTQVAGAAKLAREELSHVPGTGGDVLAAVKILPGVTATSPFSQAASSGVVIRGSSPHDSRILVDGFDIPQLYHSIMQRSVIPSAAVENLEYLPGGFDVRYGGATAGLISVTTRGGGDKFHSTAEVSAIDANLVAHGPLGKRAHYMLSLRRSYVDAYLGALIPADADVGFVTAPRYYDGLLRLDYDPSPRWHAALTVIGSDDLIKLLARGGGENSTDLTFRQDTKFVRTIGSAIWRSADGWALNMGISTMLQGLAIDAGPDLHVNIDQALGAGRFELSKSMAHAAGLSDVVVRAGIEAFTDRAVIDVAVPRLAGEGDPNGGNFNADAPKVYYRGTLWLTDAGVWSAIEASLSSRIRMSIGARVDAFTRLGRYPVQPRAELNMNVTAVDKLRLAAGRYTRPPEDTDELLNTSLRPESAAQITLGGEHSFGNGRKLQLTVYDSERTDMLVRDANGVFQNEGRGRTFGLEVLGTVRRDRFFGWLAYSLSRSVRRDAPTAALRLFDYDQTHNVVVAASYRTRNQRWIFGGKLQYASGTPYTPVASAVFDSDRNKYMPVYGTINSLRTDARHQLDVRVDRVWHVRGGTVAAFLDISNLYMNQSVVQYQYNYDYRERGAIKALPIIPSIGLRGEL